jgi:hypothetical protein
MGSPGIRILLVGNDVRLLRGRVDALNSCGAQVVLSDPAELQTHVGPEVFDLVVLCYTLSDLNRRWVTDRAHERWPRVKLMQIKPPERDFASFGSAIDNTTPDDPEAIARHAMALFPETHGQPGDAA